MNRSIGPPTATKSELEMTVLHFGLGKTAGRYNSAGATTMVDGRGPLMDKRA